MKKICIINVIFIGIFFFSLIKFTSCSSSTDTEDNSSFGLYLLGDKNLKCNEFEKLSNKDSLRIYDWIKPEMIENYDFSSHVLYLNKSTGEFDLMGNMSRPILALSNGIKCYYTCLWNSLSSYRYVTLVTLPKSNDLLQLRWGYPGEKDLRINDFIRQDLIQSGKYLEGLRLTLDDVRIIKKDTTFIEYTITITNKDNTDLFIPEPQDIILAEPNQYQSILSFFNTNSRNDFFTANIIPLPHKSIDAAFMVQSQFNKLNKGASRTYKFKQVDVRQNQPFVHLDYGTYRCYYEFFGMMGGSKSKRSMSGGRLYLGSVRSNVMEISYTENDGIVIKNRDIFSEN